MSSRFNKGFSLIEIFVAVAIMLAITSIVVLNKNKVGEGPVLKNNADLISLAIRQAQANSISVKESAIGSGNFNNGYGVEFAMSNPTSYISFIDTNGNGVVDGVGEIQTTNTLTNSNTISNLCYELTSGGVGGEFCGQQKVDIKFLRPNTSAILYINGSRGAAYQAVKIVLTSSSGLTRSVYVYTTGQISVQ